MLVQMRRSILLTAQYSTSIDTLHTLFKICKLVKRFERKLQLNVPVGFSTGVIGRLAAHVGVFHLDTEQRAVCAHAQLVPL